VGTNQEHSTLSLPALQPPLAVGANILGTYAGQHNIWCRLSQGLSIRLLRSVGIGVQKLTTPRVEEVAACPGSAQEGPARRVARIKVLAEHRAGGACVPTWASRKQAQEGSLLHADLGRVSVPIDSLCHRDPRACRSHRSVRRLRPELDQAGECAPWGVVRSVLGTPPGRSALPHRVPRRPTSPAARRLRHTSVSEFCDYRTPSLPTYEGSGYEEK